MSSAPNLSDVPEEVSFTPRLPYTCLPASASTSTFNSPTIPPTTPSINAAPRPPTLSRKSSNLRVPAGERSRASSTSEPPRQASSSSGPGNASGAASKDAKNGKPNGSTPASDAVPQKIRTNPRLPHDKDAEPAPTTIMYWSRAPVHGAIPMRSMRAHSVTLVDSVAWLFGGCDDKDCWKDIYCFDTETMQWSHPDTQGDIPPPCRAHTATLMDRKIFVIGGGQGPVYYNTIFVLDTVTRRWSNPTFSTAIPAPRRAHTAVAYRNKIWVFGGGNGMQALNDVWTLDVMQPADKMKWEEIVTKGRKPSARGYHTANVIGNVMVVVGGSDGKECFSDIWCLNLDSLVWSQVKLQVTNRRLSHTATQVGSYLFILGGHNGSDYTSEILPLNLVSLQYETRPINGKPPPARGYHAAILADSRLFCFGGFNGHVVYDDVWILDLAAAAYLPQVTSFKIMGSE